MTLADLIAYREALAETRIMLSEVHGVIVQALIDLKLATARMQRVEVALGEARPSPDDIACRECGGPLFADAEGGWTCGRRLDHAREHH